MVIIFMNEKARNQLLNKGIVYTIRHIRKIEGVDWMTDKRGGKKICNVRISYCANGNYKELFNIAPNYINETGFDTIEEWINILMVLGKLKHYTFWLYRVEKVL